MCGIAGIVTRDRSAFAPDVLPRMGAVIAHRGPDDAGTWVSPDLSRGVGLVHRRLSIIDLSAAGHQPMTNEDGSLWVTYNGEIYNHAGLRGELEAAGHRYHSRTDTETILHAYEQWGDDCMQRFRGMFAFGLWDSNRRRLLLVRDRLGIKPVYYAPLPDGGLVFGSEIKALLASGLVRATASQAALSEYLLFGYLAGEQTMFEGISILPPGHLLVWDDEGLRVRPYWTLRFSPQPASEQELSDRFAQTFDEAVRLRLMSDVPLGVFLSGGLDSSAIAAVMNRHVGERLSTFSIGFPTGHYSELPYARMVAEHLGANHHEVILTADDFITSLPRMVWHEDEPIWTIASVAMYHVSRLASQHVKVVLTGEGSDELFAGYDRYWSGVLNARFAGPYQHVPAPVRHAVRWLLAQRVLPERARRALSHTFLGREATPESLVFDNWFGIFTPAMQQAFCGDDLAAVARSMHPYAAHLEHFRSSGSEDPLDQMLYVDIKTNLVELLMKQDQMSMATSIESRVPFLDHHLVEFAATIPASAKLGRFSGKRLVKHAVRDLLPEAIVNRRKQGFPVPFDAWLRKDFAGHVSALLLSDRSLGRGWFKPDRLRHLVQAHAAGTENASRQLWALLTLELWARIFLDEERDWLDAPDDAWHRVRAERPSSIRHSTAARGPSPAPADRRKPVASGVETRG
jgi:asparagine synthase (glutamine-hydrolysing)